MIHDWDFLIRLMSLGSALTLIAMVVASEVRLSVRVPLIGVLVGSVGYLLNTPMMTERGPATPWIEFFAISTPFWIWLFGRRLFEREPEQRIMLVTAALMVLGWFLQNFLDHLVGETGFVLLHVVAVVLVVDLVRVGIFERGDDLVEDRRIVRFWFPLLVALQAGQILLIEMLEPLSPLDSRHPIVSIINSTLILVFMLFASLTLFRTNRELLPKTSEEQRPYLPKEMVPELDLSPSEKALHDRLVSAMDEGAYSASGLTIAALAKQLDTPEHRLRALINQRLGHRNFSAFLNGYRIAEAQKRLSSSENVDLPILTIAMDLGYNSLPPFNRAFRELSGSSPSEFRKRAFVAPEPQTEHSDADQN